MISDSQNALLRALPTEAETIAALTDAAYTKYIPRLGRKPQPMTADYGQILAEHPVWLICVEGQPVGSIVLMAEPEAMLIYSIAVSPQYQQHGLGARLLSWAEGQAQEAGFKLIRLYTNEHMQENIEWYKRSGYVETRREAYLGSTLVHMAKKLDS